MAKKNHDAAVAAALTIAAAVALNTVELVGAPQELTTAITVKTTQSTQVPTGATQAATDATAPTNPPAPLYDVPLDRKLQLHIVQVAKSYGIDPAILFAICLRESSYDPTSIGDNGEAYGLMQIQPRWHSDRMEQLGCTNLLDPYQNVIVGADYLAEQVSRYDGDMGKALVAYNAGHYRGTITRYAQEVLEIAEELRGTVYEATDEGV